MTFDPMIDQELGCTKQIRTKWIIVGRKTATLGQFNRFAQIKSRFYGEKSAEKSAVNLAYHMNPLLEENLSNVLT